MVGDDSLIPVVILALLEESVMHSPVVILHDPESNRVLPIWIGEPEARAIAIAYQGVETSRPLTHTLFAGTLHELGVDLIQVVIEKMEANTYYAALHLHISDEEELVMDARPSDAIALALELDAPIFVASSVLDRAGQDNPFPARLEDAQAILASNDEMSTQPTERKKGSSPKAKENFTKEELTQLTNLLKKARAREFGADNQ